ncbi:MAG: cytochrome c553 [Gammaproteobacteria bacterium]|jgi:cytochrome c553
MKLLLSLVCMVILTVSLPGYADAKAGQSAYAAKGCIGCHGVGGKSVVPTYPSLKGQEYEFVKKNLTDFRSGARANPTMNAMAASLSDADIENIAAYIDSLK